MSRIVHTDIWSAYGYAKKAGYTGTVEEFEAGLKKSAEADDHAAASAEAAAASEEAAGRSAEAAASSEGNAALSESAAQGYANDAAGSASDASGYATTAQTKAGQAGESAGYAERDAGIALAKAGEAAASATAASTDALKAEGYAVGKQGGEDVSSDSPYYHNNTKYYCEQATTAATNAGNAQTAAETAQGKAEDAQEAAEAAQAACEAVEESIPEDYSVLNDTFWTFSGLSPITMIGENKYIATSGAVGSTVSLTPSTGSGYKYAIVPCSAGDTFLINATGGQAPRIWCFIDSNDVILSRDTATNHSVTNLVLTAPTNAANLILNNKDSNTSYIGTDRMARAESDIATLSTNLDAYTGGANVVLSNDANLNAITTPGNYVSNSDTVSGMTNLPDGYPNRQFRMRVDYVAKRNQAYIMQELIPRNALIYNGTRIYKFYRTGNTNGTWSPWFYVSMGDIATDTSNGLMSMGDKYKIGHAEEWLKNENELFPSEGSSIADLLLLENTAALFHDNFWREDNATDIGNNGSGSRKYLYHDMAASNTESENIQVGISGHKAVASNPYSVSDVKRIKYTDVASWIYKVIMSFDGKGVFVISPDSVNDYIYVSATANSFSVGGIGKYAMEEQTVTHNGGLSTIAVYVYPDSLNVYVAGVNLGTFAIAPTNTNCGILFDSSDINNIAYTNFDILRFRDNLPTNIDRAIEAGAPITREFIGNPQTADASYGVLLDTYVTKNSKRSIRFEQRKADAQIMYRSEITVHNPREANRALQTKIIEFDLYLPEHYGDDTGNDIILQMHHTPDGVVSDALNPSIAFNTTDGHFTIKVRYAVNKPQSSDELIVSEYDLGAFEDEKWYHVVIFLHEGYLAEHNPCTAVWIDGKNVLLDRNPNAYNTTDGSYLKLGMYKPQYVYPADTGSTVRIVYFDNLRIWM